ncbi:MAG TPA: ATP-dependent DNA helicase [Candidatus Paceibacterota bacterium]|nr:ATP-dependent DNA helicase [Candidatus Paceibacterota bacterium]
MKDFAAEYKKLNKSQKDAVDAIEGPVMVVAGPGTGKTQILTLRIANILKKTQLDPENILALTFTEAGAKEMRRRLRDLVGPAADRVRLHTYHGFAGSVIREFDDHFPDIARAKQITEIEQETIIREILKDKKFYKLRPAGDPDLYVGKILGAISDSKQEAWTPEMVAKFAEKEIKNIETGEEWLSTRGPTKGQIKAEGLRRIEKCQRTILFAEVYERYETKKREQRKIDFDDLILEVITTLRQDKLLLQLLQEKFQYILVDEHQDTNDSQNALIRLIAEFFDNPNLFVVGDEKQAIYRFQGASVDNFMSFQKQWSGMKIIRLEQNYRSRQPILDASFSMIENNYADGEYPELRIKLHSNSDDEPKPLDFVQAGNGLAADEYFLEQVREIIKNHPQQTTAVIVRRNADVQRALTLLEQNGIPASAERGSDIFAEPMGLLFFSLLEFLADPSQTEALAYGLAGGLWQLPIDTRAKLIRALRSGKLSEVQQELPDLEYLREQINRCGAVAFAILTAEKSGLTDMASTDPIASQVWRGIVSLAEELARQNPDSPSELIRNLLEYRTSAGSRNIKIALGSAEAPVRIMTAHASKGLEFDNVFLPYAVEESWLPRNHGDYFVLPRQGESEDNLRDERRLFYVALTRAKSRVFIISPLEEGGRMLTPLRFIYELEQSQLAKTDLPASLKQPVKEISLKPETKRRQEAIEYAKRILTEYGLSPTALNHFCECPLQFFYKSVLRLPEPPSTAAEKGNAMHEAMAAVWHLGMKNEKIVTDTMAQAIKNYFQTSLLPSYEKEPALEALLEDAPKVAASLLNQNHFEQTGKISTETSRELLVDGLMLRGKLDALIEDKAKTFVFDYKTREAMSINAIKGETKTDSDGNYFRQLVFYKFLLSGEKKAGSTGGVPVEPALVFIKPDAKGNCKIVSLPIEETDTEKLKQEIKTLYDSIQSGKFLDQGCGEKFCNYCTLGKMI